MRLPGIMLLFILCMRLPAEGQQTNVWAFGNGGGIDFNTTPPTAITTAISTTEGCASISAADGQLLFYTNGSNVYNRNHLLMPNGNNLTGLAANATASTSQGTVIVPVPDYASRYYVFSLSDNALTQAPDKGKLFYSIVDMNLDGGLGDVIPVSKGILIDSLLTEHMTAVAADQCHIWLLNISSSWQLKARLITNTGIAASPVTSALLTPAVDDPWNVVGCMSLSGNGQKLALARRKDLTIYDFDPSTGMAGNGNLLSASNATLLPSEFYGLCFSPNNSKLYVTANGPVEAIFQFNLSLGNNTQVASSKTVIAQPATSGIKLGPDGRVYISEFDQSALHVINNPNAAGVACQYQPLALPLVNGTMSRIGLPNVIAVPINQQTGAFYNSNAACFALEHTITSPDTTGWNYLWSNGDTTRQIVVNAPGLYFVSYRTACVLHTDTINVSFPYPLPELLIQPSCYNDNNGMARLIPSAPDLYAFTWKNNSNDTLSLTDSLSPVSPGAYMVHIRTATGCDTALSVTIPSVQYAISMLTDTLICTGTEVHFENTSDNHFNAYTWYFGDNQLSLQQDAVHIYTDGGYYTVMLVGKGPVCTDTAYRKIRVDMPVPDAYLKLDRNNICLGESVRFSHNMDSSSINLQWNFGKGDIINKAEEEMIHAYDEAGSMPVKLSIQYRACPAQELTDTVHVYAFPLVDLGPEQSLCLRGRPLLLTNTREEAGQKQQWNTGDTTAYLYVKHPGEYALTVTNVGGCATTETVTVSKDCYTDIPNAFTPDGDGYNDYFYPRQLLSAGATAFQMTVYNRWGQKVFETTHKDGRGWDGRFNGVAQPQGVYPYKIEVTFKNTQNESYTGNVTLLR